MLILKLLQSVAAEYHFRSKTGHALEIECYSVLPELEVISLFRFKSQ
jgi:hypothetical protein